MPKSPVAIPITGDHDADALLETDPLALVVGMLLDQQVSMETAFLGPSKLKARLGETFDAASIAAMDPDEFIEVCREKPAIHRFPKAMGARIHDLCRVVVADYDGDPSHIWKGVRSGTVLHERLSALPGFGEEKTKIFIALLAKRLGVAPKGWQEVAAPFSDDVPRSIADVGSPDTLAQVREWKRAQKAAGRSKQD
jgi:uncharacterized HhH-GPD family protein